MFPPLYESLVSTQLGGFRTALYLSEMRGPNPLSVGTTPHPVDPFAVGITKQWPRGRSGVHSPCPLKRYVRISSSRFSFFPRQRL